MYDQVIDFVRQTFQQPQGVVPLHAPRFIGNEKKYLCECIDTTYVSSVGKFVDLFEDMVAEYTGAKRAVVCVNGTNALHIAMLLAGVQADDEVISQPLTFIATANAISYIGAFPIFLDVDLDTMGLSPARMREWLRVNTVFRNNECYNKISGRRIKACVPMHTFGHPVHLDELVELCHEYHIELVEDAAESMGSYYKGKHTGIFGRIGVISFNGNKTITAGGGGMLLFMDEELGKYGKHLTTQAKVSHRWEFVHDDVGYNYRMPNINAALGCAQMEHLQEFVNNKRELARRYADFFMNTDITFFSEPNGCKSNYWLNAIILQDKFSRDRFLEETNDAGVMTRPVWQLMNRLPMFRKCQCGDLSNAEWLEERVVNLPSSVRL